MPHVVLMTLRVPQEEAGLCVNKGVLRTGYGHHLEPFHTVCQDVGL